MAIHRLDILDKHRLLLPVVTVVAANGIEVEDERTGEVVTGCTWAVAHPGPFFIILGPHINIKNKAQLVTDVESGEGLPAEDMLVSETLHRFKPIFLSAVQLLESVR